MIMDEVGDTCKIKGSGCIRTREHFLKLIDMGIDRMGIGYRSVPVSYTHLDVYKRQLLYHLENGIGKKLLYKAKRAVSDPECD